MILKELFNILSEELGARRLVAGEPGHPVKGLAIDEEAKSWFGPDEVALTDRKNLDSRFLALVTQASAPAVVWRTDREPSEETVRQAGQLGLGLLTLPASVPLRAMLSLFMRDAECKELLQYSHKAARVLTESVGGEASVAQLAEKLASVLGHSVVLEDPVGRLIASGDPTDGSRSKVLLSTLEEYGLRASKNSGVEETRRERCDRYAMLPDGFLSVPIERWRVAGTEFFWTPIAAGAPAGYLWIDLAGSVLRATEVVTLYWAARALGAELGKERVRLETELGVRGDFIDDTINGHHGSTELLLQRARYLGADLSSGALSVVVDIDDFASYLGQRKLKESAIQELKRRLTDGVGLQAQQLFSNFLLGPRSDNVILFLGPSKDVTVGDLVEKAPILASRVQRYVGGLLPDLTVSVGIGRFKNDPAALSDAYSEANVALEVGHRIHGPSSVLTFEQTGTYKLLFRVLQKDPEELETFYEETLAPLVSYDSRYGTELVQTLTTYLSNDASPLKTAADLLAHRHTIRYRLKRVRELTHLDANKSEDRERLTLGIKAMQLLGRTPEKPSSFAVR